MAKSDQISNLKHQTMQSTSPGCMSMALSGEEHLFVQLRCRPVHILQKNCMIIAYFSLNRDFLETAFLALKNYLLFQDV
jgi:hypothetical protein